MKFIILMFLILPHAMAARDWVKKLSLPKGFTIEQTIEVPEARQMARDEKGNLYVGSMEKGLVHKVTPEGKVTVLFENLNMPEGVLWHKGELYIAEINKVSKVKDLDKKPSLITIKEFPNKKWHGWKTINEGPDGKLYVPVGAPCNVCEEKLPFAALHRMDFDGKDFETVATGIRNTVGFTWHPQTKELYFTDMGRDLMGDDVPPDEINVIKSKNPHFGFPYIHGNDIQDPQFGKLKPKDLKISPPAQIIQAHSAPIGIAFFPKNYPQEFQGCFLVAEHGSWNRSKKSGYQVTKGCVVNGMIKNYGPFITGFKEGEKALGRPVHFLFLEDGSFYLSEDEPGTVMKISFK